MAARRGAQTEPAVRGWVLFLVLLAAACSRSSIPLPAATPSAAQPTRPRLPTLTATNEPSATVSAVPPSTATVGPTPTGGAAELILGIVERVGADYSYGPILRYQVEEGVARFITAEEYELLGVSPAGDGILARKDTELVLLDLQGNETARISDHLLSSGVRTAAWVPGTDLVGYIEETESPGLQIYNIATGDRRHLPGTDGARELLLPSSATDLVWLGDACPQDATCEAAYVVDPVTGVIGSLTGLIRPTASPTRDYLAYLYPDEQGRRRLALTPADRSREVRMGIPGDNILDYGWSPDGSRLLVVALVRSGYSGRWFGARQFIVTPGTWDLRELPQTGTANALGIWSPDGRQVVLAGTQPESAGYVVSLRRIDLDSRKVETLEPGVDLSRPNYVFVSMMAWRPLR